MSEAQERLTRAGLAIGTLAYMSPEQTAADGVMDGRTDVYAPGCMLHEMLAGEAPFGGSRPQAVLARKGAGSTLGLSGSMDFNDGYYTDISGFSYADLGVSLDLPVGPVTVSPMVVVQRAIDDTFVDEEVVGISASMTF